MQQTGDYTIRPFKLDDLVNVARLYLSFYDERNNAAMGKGLSKKTPTLGELMQSFVWRYADEEKGNTIASVAEVNGKLVGECMISCAWPNSEMDHIGELDVAVHRDYRGRGIGTALVRDAIKRSKKRFTLIQTYVMTSNTASKKLLEKSGFKLSGSIPRRLRRNGKYHKDYLMYLEL